MVIRSFLVVRDCNCRFFYWVDERKNICFFIYNYFNKSFYFIKIVFVFNNGIVFFLRGFVFRIMYNLMIYG